MAITPNPDAIVVGAGLSGLVAASELVDKVTFDEGPAT